MSCCSERRDSGLGTRDSAGSRSRGPLKATATIAVLVGWVDPGRGPREAQRIRSMKLGFTRMESGFNPTYLLLGFRVSSLHGSRVPSQPSRSIREATAS